MPNDATRLLIESALQAIQEQRYTDALSILDQAAEADAEEHQVHELRGIAFAKTGRVEASIEAFRKATSLAPTARGFYNLGVQLSESGAKAEAKQAIEKALELDPKHLSAKKLLKELTIYESGAIGGSKSDRTSHPRTSRPYGLGKKHLFALMHEHQREWTALGWTIVGFAVVSTILVKLNFPLIAPKVPDLKNALAGYKPIRSASAFATIVFFISTILASMIWTSLDLIDRRGRVLWMIPMMLCCFLFMPFASQSLYMAIGRRD
ncbi:MAG: tetratricopeptide repeat protein [Fimbriimonas sp.]|nr:tetratricopeptide repeat protein [Fimbriimonas sp.]